MNNELKIYKGSVENLPKDNLDVDSIYVATAESKTRTSEQIDDYYSMIIACNKIFPSKEYIDSQLSNLITLEDLDPLWLAANNHIIKGSLGTINGESLEENNDITLDLSLYKIVPSLPTENISENKIYVVPEKVDNETRFTEYIYANGEWDVLGIYKDEIDLSGYLTETKANSLYLTKKNGTGTLSIAAKNGQFANYGPNGQAFLAARDVGTSNITNSALNGASFGVKLDGTAAFSHKTYTSFDANKGDGSGAKNTAVLAFSGPSGLRYAKNTGNSSDVTEDMYKYVGVIDSPDEKQRVYSVKQVDDLLAPLIARIEALENQLKNS